MKLHASLFPSIERKRVTFQVTFLRSSKNVSHSYQKTLLMSHSPDLGHMLIPETIIGQGDGIRLRPIRFPFPELRNLSPEQLVMQEDKVDA